MVHFWKMILLFLFVRTNGIANSKRYEKFFCEFVNDEVKVKWKLAAAKNTIPFETAMINSGESYVVRYEAFEKLSVKKQTPGKRKKSTQPKNKREANDEDIPELKYSIKGNPLKSGEIVVLEDALRNLNSPLSNYKIALYNVLHTYVEDFIIVVLDKRTEKIVRSKQYKARLLETFFPTGRKQITNYRPENKISFTSDKIYSLLVEGNVHLEHTEYSSPIHFAVCKRFTTSLTNLLRKEADHSVSEIIRDEMREYELMTYREKSSLAHSFGSYEKRSFVDYLINKNDHLLLDLLFQKSEPDLTLGFEKILHQVKSTKILNVIVKNLRSAERKRKVLNAREIVDREAMTPLKHFKNKKKIFAALIASGADIRSTFPSAEISGKLKHQELPIALQDDYFWTDLMKASRDGSIGNVLEAVAKGDEFDIVSQYGQIACELTADNELAIKIQNLESHYGGLSADDRLRRAVRIDDTEMAAKIMKYAANNVDCAPCSFFEDVEDVLHDLKSAEMVSAICKVLMSKSQFSVLRKLLYNRKPEIWNGEDGENRQYLLTPLRKFRFNGIDDIVEELLAFGADPYEIRDDRWSLTAYGTPAAKLQDDHTWTMLLKAARDNDLGRCKAAFKKGANPFAENQWSQTALELTSDRSIQNWIKERQCEYEDIQKWSEISKQNRVNKRKRDKSLEQNSKYKKDNIAKKI